LTREQKYDGDQDPFKEAAQDMEAYLSRPKYNDAFVEIIPTKIFVDSQITKQVILDEIS
jgi:hypothetical protein